MILLNIVPVAKSRGRGDGEEARDGIIYYRRLNLMCPVGCVRIQRWSLVWSCRYCRSIICLRHTYDDLSQMKPRTLKSKLGKKRVVKAWAVHVKDPNNSLQGNTICHFVEFDSQGLQEPQARLAIYETRKDAISYLGTNKKSFIIIPVEIHYREVRG